MTTNEKSPEVTPTGSIANVEGVTVPPLPATTAASAVVAFSIDNHTSTINNGSIITDRHSPMSMFSIDAFREWAEYTEWADASVWRAP